MGFLPVDSIKDDVQSNQGHVVLGTGRFSGGEMVGYKYVEESRLAGGGSGPLRHCAGNLSGT